MNELRWILLIAGALLIGAIYLWGLRSRDRRTLGDDASRRPAVFTGGASGFETDEPADTAAADVLEEPAIARDGRRLEPTVSLDDEDLDTQRPAIERRAGLEADDDEVATGTPAGRREPTFGRRVDPMLTSPRAEPAAGGRVEPTIARVEPAPPPDTMTRPAPPAATATPAAAAAAQAPEPARSKRPQKIFAVRVNATAPGRFSGQRVLDALQAEGLRFGRYEIFHCLHGDGRPVFSVASLRDPGTFDPQTMAETHYPGILVFAVLPGPVGAGEAFDEMLFTARALATHLDGALADDKGVPLTAHRAGRLREEALEFERSVHAA
ncbi:MAG TPA: cell division protein ZipA C-terminal FtsZ-binding domain-containing protein [Steroidobacteraceae bacterium]|nr:cell division protein ZipA C-terminal FtsZ-binding domain-containing protein [Steroidobacteraceae bacterium]